MYYMYMHNIFTCHHHGFQVKNLYTITPATYEFLLLKVYAHMYHVFTTFLGLENTSHDMLVITVSTNRLQYAPGGSAHQGIIIYTYMYCRLVRLKCAVVEHLLERINSTYIQCRCLGGSTVALNIFALAATLYM